MNFEDLRDQIVDLFNSIWGRIQESSLYHNAKERYESLPTLAQRGVAYGAGFLLVMIILSIPFSYISSSNTLIEEFNESRSLLRDLMRIGRAAKEPPPLPPGLSSADLTAQVSALIPEFNLVPEQFTGSHPLGERPAGSLAPSVIHQEGVAVSISKLNLTQVVDIGTRLQNISPGTKLTGMEIVANNEDNHYFNVTYRLVSFSLPMAAEEPPSKAEHPDRQKGAPADKSDKESEE